MRSRELISNFLSIFIFHGKLFLLDKHVAHIGSFLNVGV